MPKATKYMITSRRSPEVRITSRLYNIEPTTNVPLRSDPDYHRLMRGVLTGRFHLRLGEQHGN